MNKISTITALVSIILFGVAMLSLGLCLGISNGYDLGFDACIEENNLYDRY